MKRWACIGMRTCPGCGIAKAPDQFAKNQFRCRACKSVACKRWREKYPDRQRASEMRWRASRPDWKPSPEGRRRDARRYRLVHPIEVAARKTVREAIRVGNLIRPTKCSVCPSTLRVEAHHDDYDKPLEVRWLCCACHTAYHLNHPDTK